MKHIYLLITAFLLVAGNVLAQEDIQTASFRKGQGFYEFQYYLNEFGDTIYHGSYSKIDTTYFNGIDYQKNGWGKYRYTENGTYSHGKKINEWKYTISQNGNVIKITEPYNQNNQLDGIYEYSLEGSPQNCFEKWGIFWRIGYDFRYSRGCSIHVEMLFQNGIQREFKGEAQWNSIGKWKDPDAKVQKVFNIRLAGKYTEDGVATGEWDGYGNCDNNPYWGYKYGLNTERWGDVYFSSGGSCAIRKVRTSAIEYGSGGIEGTIKDWFDSGIGLGRLPGYNYVKKEYYWDTSIKDDFVNWFFSDYFKDNYKEELTLWENLQKPNIQDEKLNPTTQQLIKKYCSYISPNVPHSGESIYKLTDLVASHKQLTTSLQQYVALKQDYNKVVEIAKKYPDCQYLNYKEFIEKSRQRWNIIESQKDWQLYKNEIQKLHTFVNKTLTKCEKIELYNETNNKIVASKSPTEAISIYSLAYNELYNKLCNETNAETQAEYEKEIEALQKNTQEKCKKLNSYSETNNKIVANKAKKAIVTKYSFAYNELFHNLCNETNVEKQVQYEKDIEDLQSKTQEICSVVDTKAFEKQLKSASDVEQIKTLIINYK